MSLNLPAKPTIADIHELYRAQHSVPTVIRYFLERVSRLDQEIAGVVRLNSELAESQAQTLQEELERSDLDTLLHRKPLFGIPYALKDNILVEGEPLTAQSRILEGYVATYSSDVYLRLQAAGGVLVAQTNMDEFAFGSSTEFSGFGQITKNPHDTSRVPGGTSGGSAALVAVGALPVAIGTDTGGSIRQPASFTGTYGIRPTYGSVSRFGIVASTSSFDQAGPLTNSLDDNQRVLKVLQAKSRQDQTSIDLPSPRSTAKKFVVGVPAEFMGEGLDAQVRTVFEQAMAHVGDSVEFKTVSLPMSEYTLAVYYILQTVEAAANLERFDTVRYGAQEATGDTYTTGRAKFGDEAKRRIMLGTYTSSAGYYDAYYNKACMVREKIRAELNEVLKTADALLMPASPFPAFKIGENANDPLSMYLADIMTVTHPITRVPSLVIPGKAVEVDGRKLPVGLQLVGTEGSEDTLYTLAQHFTK